MGFTANPIEPEKIPNRSASLRGPIIERLDELLATKETSFDFNFDTPEEARKHRVGINNALVRRGINARTYQRNTHVYIVTRHVE